MGSGGPAPSRKLLVGIIAGQCSEEVHVAIVVSRPQDTGRGQRNEKET